MSQYHYSPLPLEGDTIRLLRLKPAKDKSADLQCELFEYSLQSSSGTHLYEALSYVWGDPGKKPCICMNDCSFYVTDNLLAALLQLRNHSMDRILWVDAICIDQVNQKEKETQIQLMAKIYGQANRVIVWLGEAAADSDQALDKIRIAGIDDRLPSSNNEVIRNSVLALLQRQWFRRIWVLQEVGTARNITIACGSAEVDGHAFCLGVDSLMGIYNAPPDLRTLIRSVTYLIRGAMFRPRGLGWVSNEICPLSELIDMYHTHEATLQSDKVYALLGMSSDNFHKTGLAPDYNVPWKVLFETLTRRVLGKEISVDVLPESESAMIKGKGCILGSIFSTEDKAAWNGRHNVDVMWGTARATARRTNVQSSRWMLHPSAKQIMKGDIVCIFQGAPKPTVIRLYQDHWTIIAIAATPPKIIREGDEGVEWSRYLQKTDCLRARNLQCTWNWEKSLGEIPCQEGDKAPTDCLKQIKETWNNTLIFVEGEAYRKAEETFQDAMKNYEMASRDGRLFDFPVKQLSSMNFDLDLMNINFLLPPLSWAAEMGYEAVVNLLIRRLNANVNFRKQDRMSWTALQVAARRGHLAIVEQLLQEKADVNAAAADCIGRTALQVAAEGGHLAVVERLIQAKSDANSPPALVRGRTALQAAAGRGHLAVVERLLQEKADVNAAVSARGGGKLALQAAAEGGHLAVVERLLQEKADVNAVQAAERGGKTALQVAAGGGHLAVVERLIQEKADVNTVGEGVRTPLQAAAEGGHLAVVERLLQEKPKIRTIKKYGARLQAAAEGGHLAVVKQLIQEKADVNAVGEDGRTALQAAAERGHLAVVKRLIQAKANVNAPPAAEGWRGTTALEAAAKGGHLTVVKRLMHEKPEGDHLKRVKRRL